MEFYLTLADNDDALSLMFFEISKKALFFNLIKFHLVSDYLTVFDGDYSIIEKI